MIHVASWAARFLFTGEQLNQPVGSLSGGERARVLIAKLMLQPADLLLLDEPTNDLDIPTLEVLEESLLEFRGRWCWSRTTATCSIAFRPWCSASTDEATRRRFADYSQWEAWQDERKEAAKPETPKNRPRETAATPAKKRLSYLKRASTPTIEPRIAEAEELLRPNALPMRIPLSPAIRPRCYRRNRSWNSAGNLDELYARWEELAAKAE